MKDGDSSGRRAAGTGAGAAEARQPGRPWAGGEPTASRDLSAAIAEECGAGPDWPQVNRPFWRGRTVLVTGASGFKGSWLAEALLRCDARVVGVVRPKSQPASFYFRGDLARRMDTACVDVSDARAVLELINSVRPDVIFHLAAMSTVPVCRRDPTRAFEVNVLGALHVLDACRRLAIVEKLLVCSTDHVFGQPDRDDAGQGFAEDEPLGHGSPYDSSKVMMEIAVRSFVESYAKALPEVVLSRCTNVFGPGDENQRRIVPEFVGSALWHGRISPRYPLTRRQYLGVLDVAEGYMKAVELPGARGLLPIRHFAPRGHAASGGEGATLSARDLAHEIAAVAASRDRSVVVDAGGRMGDFAPGEARTLALDSGRTRRELRWEPRCDFRRTLSATFRWYEELLAGGMSAATDARGAPE